MAAGWLLGRTLNPVIRGWANYHRHVSAKATFGRVDNEVWQALWRWAKRRHPEKSVPWIRHADERHRSRCGPEIAAATSSPKPDESPLPLTLPRKRPYPAYRFLRLIGRHVGFRLFGGGGACWALWTLYQTIACNSLNPSARICAPGCPSLGRAQKPAIIATRMLAWRRVSWVAVAYLPVSFL